MEPTVLETSKSNEAALGSKGRRRINVIWEVTQATIALMVVMGNLLVAIHVGLYHDGKDIVIPTVLGHSLFLVIGFYFGRTNHTRVGGIGRKPYNEYEER